MAEIGGYFGLERLAGQEFYPELTAVNNARNGLVYLLRARGVRKLHIPYYLCDTVARVCEREGFAWAGYHVGRDFLPVFPADGLAEGEYLYVVNYFGRLDDGEVLHLKERYGRIILDNVQAFFRQPLAGVDTIYSCRKFFGVPDGGYVSTDARLPEALPQGTSGSRMGHLLGRFEESASAHYAAFQESEEAMYGERLCAMSELTHNLLRAIDYRAVRERRERNFAALHRVLGPRNRLQVILPPGPFAYPFWHADGPAVRRKLAREGIYIPTLWPWAFSGGETEKEMAENILPLPCDQRYGEEEMKTIGEAVIHV